MTVMKEPAIEVKIHAGFMKDRTTESVILYHRMQKALLENVPEAQVSTLLEKELGNVALEKPYELYGGVMAYSYEDKWSCVRGIPAGTRVLCTGNAS